MELIDATHLIVPDNRQRKLFNDRALDELADSILDKGLMHPLVVRDDKRTLVAGERRLRALRRLAQRDAQFYCNGVLVPPGKVPCTLLGDLNPLQLLEAELEENTIRTDLTWQEHNEALAQLHSLNVEKGELAHEKVTLTDTAKGILDTLGVEATPAAVSSNVQKVSKALLLAENLSDPEVAAAKTEKEALKIIERKRAAAHREQLAAQFGEMESSHTFICGDTFEELGKIEEAVDLVITDPPYGVDAHAFGDQASNVHAYQDDVEFAIKSYAHVFQHSARLGAKAIFAFCDIRLHPTLCEMASQLLPGYSCWDTPLIWYKRNGMLPVPDHGPRRTYEAIFYAYSGERGWLSTGSPDVFDISGVTRPEFGAQKPPEIYAALASTTALPGDTLLDPFAGTCPAAFAAERLQLRAICIEQSKEKIDYAKVHLNSPQQDSESRDLVGS